MLRQDLGHATLPHRGAQPSGQRLRRLRDRARWKPTRVPHRYRRRGAVAAHQPVRSMRRNPDRPIQPDRVDQQKGPAGSGEANRCAFRLDRLKMRDPRRSCIRPPMPFKRRLRRAAFEEVVEAPSNDAQELGAN